MLQSKNLKCLYNRKTCIPKRPTSCKEGNRLNVMPEIRTGSGEHFMSAWRNAGEATEKTETPTSIVTEWIRQIIAVKMPTHAGSNPAALT